MNPPKKLIKTQVREKNTPIKRKLPKSLIYLFSTAQLIFALNFGFVNPTCKKLKYAVNFMMISMASVVILIQWMYAYERLWTIIYSVHYIPTFITLFFSRQSLREFLTDILIILDGQSRGSTVNKVGPIAWLYLTSWFVIKTSVTSFFIWSIVPLYAGILWLGLDIISIANFILFYLVFVCMRCLKEELAGQAISADRFYTTYKAIADSFGKFRRSYDGIFIWCFLGDSLKWMSMIWHYLVFLHLSFSWWQIGFSSMYAFHYTKLIIAPAVCAEMINVESDAIKMILRKRCSTETDSAESAKWALVSRYVEARPLLRKAWRLVPVDLQQPITIFSICITYIIVIVQFTHLYD